MTFLPETLDVLYFSRVTFPPLSFSPDNVQCVWSLWRCMSPPGGGPPMFTSDYSLSEETIQSLATPLLSMWSSIPQTYGTFLPYCRFLPPFYLQATVPSQHNVPVFWCRTLPPYRSVPSLPPEYSISWTRRISVPTDHFASSCYSELSPPLPTSTTLSPSLTSRLISTLTGYPARNESDLSRVVFFLPMSSEVSLVIFLFSAYPFWVCALAHDAESR